MDGKALVWFRELRANNSVTTWAEFVRSMQTRFDKGSYDDPMETLSKLKQVGWLDDYKNQFDTVALKVHAMPKAHKLSCFLGGLRDEIRVSVQMFNPGSLVSAYSLVRTEVECVFNSRKSSRFTWNSTQFKHSNSGWSASLPGHPKGNLLRSPTRGTLPGPLGSLFRLRRDLVQLGKVTTIRAKPSFRFKRSRRRRWRNGEGRAYVILAIHDGPRAMCALFSNCFSLRQLRIAGTINCRKHRLLRRIRESFSWKNSWRYL
jgi:hypothetical protein